MAVKKIKYMQGVTLIEILVVVLLVVVLASLGFVNYSNIRERAIEKEARANLELIVAAERIYFMEQGFYFQGPNISAINTNLKLSLPSGSNRNWDYLTKDYGTSACAQSNRVGGTTNFRMRNTDDEPSTGACP